MDRPAGYLELGRAEGSHEDLEWEKAESAMFDVWSPTLLLLGVPGNVLTLLVLGRLWQRVPAYLFLMALAVSDLGILLLGLLPRVFNKHLVYIEDSNGFMCSLMKWFNHANGMLSSFFLAGVNVFRALSVARPVQMRNVQHRTVHWIIAAITVCSFALNLYVPFNKALVDGKCDWTNSFMKNYYGTVSWINALLYSGLPILVMAISHVVMLRVIIRIRFRRNTLFRRARNKVTAILAVTSLAFIILGVPTTIVRILRHVDPAIHNKPYFNFLYSFTLLLWYTNAAINFYLYIMTGDDLRQRFLYMICSMPCCLTVSQQQRPPQFTSEQSEIERELPETSQHVDTTVSPLPARSARRVKISASVAPSKSSLELSEVT